jgi:hypothetical protein
MSATRQINDNQLQLFQILKLKFIELLVIADKL